MNVIALDGDGHAAVQALLPWFVTGRLDAGEQAEVEAHLAGCARCRAELAFERQLQALQALPDDDAAAGDVEQGLATMRQRIAAEALPQPQSGRGGWRWWHGVLGAQFAALLVLATALLLPRADGERYRGQGSAGPAANAIVMFGPETTEAQIRAALRHSGAQLVGGPTATQAWLVVLPRADAETLARLRSLPGVTLAESLDSGGAR